MVQPNARGSEALNIEGISFMQVICGPANKTPSLSIAAGGTVTANAALTKALGGAGWVKLYASDGFEHIALRTAAGEQGTEGCLRLTESGRLGRVALADQLVSSGVRLPAYCRFSFDESSGAWYGRIVPREVTPKPRAAAMKPRKSGLDAILAEKG
ncbi:hypothetical protein ACH6CV_16200 [Bacillota bacterium Meth-B3]|nr:hypothetical protein [Christensenellaceae bacterium]MEA5066820.1 hypothetical protein [Eubacteriales bacterium]MEA5068104.1 hypothetical protein [Christensenellaceae bacterium]